MLLIVDCPDLIIWSYSVSKFRSLAATVVLIVIAQTPIFSFYRLTSMHTKHLNLNKLPYHGAMCCVTWPSFWCKELLASVKTKFLHTKDLSFVLHIHMFMSKSEISAVSNNRPSLISKNKLRAKSDHYS